MSQNGPCFFAIGRLAISRLLHVADQCKSRIDLGIRWRPAQQTHVHRSDAIRWIQFLGTLTPESCLLQDKRVVQEHQALKGAMGGVALAYGRGRFGEIESRQEFIGEIAPYLQIDRSA